MFSFNIHASVSSQDSMTILAASLFQQLLGDEKSSQQWEKKVKEMGIKPKKAKKWASNQNLPTLISILEESSAMVSKCQRQ